MIHIAEAAEAKGRVVVHSSSRSVSVVALKAAVWLARAFQSEIESLYVENPDLVMMAQHSISREVSFSGRRSSGIDIAAVEREFRFASTAFHQAIESCARSAEVAVRNRVIRDDAVNALNAVCTDCGPWNAVALAEPFTSPHCPSVKSILENVRDATGLLLVGPKAVRSQGPIVIALEEPDLLSAMLAVAERLAAVSDTPVEVCLSGTKPEDLTYLEGAARIVLTGWPHVRLAGTIVTHGSEAALAEALRRIHPGIVIGQYGGLLMSETTDLRPLAASLECPLLLMR